MGPAPQMENVPQAELQTEGWGGMGHAPIPQTFTPDAFSAQWMNPGFSSYGQQQGQPNWFAMPGWGRNAVTGGALTQQMMQPQQQLPQQQLPQQLAPQLAPQHPGKAPKKPVGTLRAAGESPTTYIPLEQYGHAAAQYHRDNQAYKQQLREYRAYQKT